MTRPRPLHERRHGAFLAAVLGLKAASRQLGVAPSTLSVWRQQVERETAEVLPRRNPGHRRRLFPLSRAQCREIAERRASKGTSWGRLAIIYRVSRSTCQRAAAIARGEAA